MSSNIRVVWSPCQVPQSWEGVARGHAPFQKGNFQTEQIQKIHDLYARCDRTCSPLFALFVTVRINGVKNFLKDFFIPLTANYAAKVKNIALRYLAYLGCIFVDAVTLLFRAITLLPRIALEDTGCHIPQPDEEESYKWVTFHRQAGDTNCLIERNGTILISDELDDDGKYESNDKGNKLFISQGTWYALSYTHSCDIPKDPFFLLNTPALPPRDTDLTDLTKKNH